MGLLQDVALQLGLACAVGSLVTVLIKMLRNRESRQDTVLLRSDNYVLRMSGTAAGLVEAVCHGEASLNAELLSLIRREDRTIDIAAISIGSLLSSSEARDALVEALQRGVTVRIILAHPSSVELRERQECKERGDLAREILDTLQRLLALRASADRHGHNLQVRLSTAGMSFFLVAASSRMLVQPYPYSAHTADTLFLTFREGSELYSDSYRGTFSSAWNQSDMVVSMPDGQTEAVDWVHQLAEAEGISLCLDS